MHDSELPADTPTRRQHIGCIALVLILAGGLTLVALSTCRLNQFVQSYEARFPSPAWTRLDGKTIDQTTEIDAPTLIFSGEATLSGAAADIAILGGDATLHGVYTGNVHFLGRNLDLADDGVIEGNLEIAGARHVTLRGVVRGELTGVWDRLFGDGTSVQSSP